MPAMQKRLGAPTVDILIGLRVFVVFNALKFIASRGELPWSILSGLRGFCPRTYDTVPKLPFRRIS